MYKLYTDGGSRGNPGHAGIGYICFDQQDNPVFTKKEYIGVATNNQAEYLALVKALKECLENNVKEVSCFLDSELVVRQLNGQYKMKNEGLKPLFFLIKNYSKHFESISFNHIPREDNNKADDLVNEVLDEYLM